MTNESHRTAHSGEGRSNEENAAAPVAWMYDGPDGQHYINEHRDIASGQLIGWGWTETPLYAQPVQKMHELGEGRSNGAGDLSSRRFASARGHLTNIRAHGNAEENACHVIERVLASALAALSDPQGEVERLRAAMKQAEIHIDCASFRKAQDILLAALAQSEGAKSD